MTKLADIFRRELWTMEEIKNSTELLNFSKGKHIVKNALISEKVNAQDSGTSIRIPYVQEGVYVEPVVMNDSDDEITSEKVTKKEDKAYVGFYALSFAQKNIVSIIGSGIDPLEAALGFVSRNIEKDLQRKQISTLKGLVAENIANDASDLVKDASTEVFSYDLVLDTLDLLGDANEGFVTVFAHSRIVNRMKKNNDISTILDSERGILIDMYNGLEVIKNDAFAPTASVYDVIFAKAGLFAFEMSSKIAEPIVYVKNEKTGNGAGESTLISRYGMLLHPQGYTFNDDLIADVSPINAELEQATSWTRTCEAKQSLFVVLKCKAD